MSEQDEELGRLWEAVGDAFDELEPFNNRTERRLLDTKRALEAYLRRQGAEEERAKWAPRVLAHDVQIAELEEMVQRLSHLLSALE